MNFSIPVSFFVFGAGIASIVWAVFTYTGDDIADKKVPGAVRHGSEQSNTVSDLDDSAGDHSGTAKTPAAKNQEVAVLARVVSLETDFANLRESLELEQSGRLELQQELASLEAELLQLKSVSLGESSVMTQAGEELTTQSSIRSANERGQRQFPRGGGSRDDPDHSSLLAAGIDQGAAYEILKRLDERSLAMLELRDLATREGWVGSDRYVEQRRAIRDSVDLRDELGNDGYDAYLYTSGRSNRVTIESIIDGSAAAQAGMEINDMVLSYANKKVYSSRDLQRATMEGERFEPVTIVLVRDSTPLSVSVARGPLGVTLTERREPPISLPTSISGY